MALKVALEDITINTPGILYGNVVSTHIKDVMESPRTHAVELGFSVANEEEVRQIKDEDLQEAVKKWLAKYKNSHLRDIDNYLTYFNQYKISQKSDAVDGLINRLDGIKEMIMEDDWHGVAVGMIQIKEYLEGLRSLLNLMLGDQHENDKLKETFELPKIKPFQPKIKSFR